MFPHVEICRVPGRHVVLGFSLAELANGAGRAIGVDIPAAHFSRPAVIGLRLLDHKRWERNEPTGRGGGGRGHFWQGRVGPSISDLHHFLSGTSAFSAWWRHVLHSTSCDGEGLTGLKGCVYRKQCNPPWQIQVIYVCLVKKTKFWNTQSESQRLDNWHESCTAAFPARLSLLIYNRRLCSLACVLLNMLWFFLENTEKPSARQGAWAKRWGGGQKRKTGERKDSLGI